MCVCVCCSRPGDCSFERRSRVGGSRFEGNMLGGVSLRGVGLGE